MLRRGPPYASAAVLGAGLYVGLVAGLDVRKLVAQLAAVALILLVRGIAQWRGWESIEPKKLTPVVLRPNDAGNSTADPDATKVDHAR